MAENYMVTSSPHIHGDFTVKSIMLDVIIALVPAGLAGIFYFGLRSLAVILTSVISCVLFEFIWNKLFKKPNTTGDLSAFVTGLLIAYNMPPTIPLWMVVIGCLFAIIVVKQLFGGLGQNFVNPALAARAFMLASWAGAMTTWISPSLFGSDAMSSATPLSILKAGGEKMAEMPHISKLIMGDVGGCIGETSALLLAVGGLYLLMRGVIKMRTPLSFILTVAVCMFIFGGGEGFYGRLYFSGLEIFSGGLFLGAIFMATDYTTSPTTPKGQVIMGIGCGLLTSLIRLKGGYPEGVSYSILLMNIVTPLIDRYTVPTAFGTGESKKEKFEKKVMKLANKKKKEAKADE
ncbi:MAG: RnfABCDGE type electron transport complex subunit D [Ruminococcaceae bacterium]|nr:RnfABCDGE type electron transport complex subunit D [Oscillospiraceae bacterium]